MYDELGRDEYDCGFKDDMNSDIATFLNVEEFSAMTIVDGVEIPCQVVHYTGDKSNRQNETYAGLHGDFTTVFFETAVYKKFRERLPRNGEWVEINGKRYDIVSVKNELGIVKVVCSAYRQNTLRSNFPFSSFTGT